MSTVDTASAFAGATNERNPSAKFHQIGTTYKGTVTRVGEYAGVNTLNGKHEISVVVDLELAETVSGTDANGVAFTFDPGDTVTLFCRTHLEGEVVPNGLTRAVADAVRAAGRAGLPEVGGTLAVRYESQGQASKPGQNPPKIYRAQYAPPAGTPSSQVGGPFDQPAAAAPAAAQQQPVAQPAPQPAQPQATNDLF